MSMSSAFLWTLPALGALAGGTWWARKRIDALSQKLVMSEARCELLRQSEARFQAIADYTYGVEAWLNPKGKLIWINRSIERLSGYTPLECLIMPDLVGALFDSEYQESLRHRLSRSLLSHQDGGLEVRMQHKDGSSRWVGLTWRALHNKAGAYLGLRVSVDDIEARKQIEQQLHQQATRDPLTGLYNRRRFDEELARMLADAIRRDITIGLLAVDLDGFKPINDKYGHQAGDEVLTTLAHEVGSTIRKAETFFRLGGDEFALLVSDTNRTDMMGLAQRINNKVASLQFSFDGGKTQVQLTASLGIAMFPDHADSAEVLIAEADRAMYAAKEQGKNSWQLAAAD
jgi:diguanylate cyclase (GGDEF)-like protein/PAS domain S-box-containing protein